MPVAENMWRANYSTSGSLQIPATTSFPDTVVAAKNTSQHHAQMGETARLRYYFRFRKDTSREFQRYTTQDAELVDNSEGKERILQRISSCPDPVWFTCKLFASKNHKNLQLGALLSSFKRHILENLRAAEQIQLLRQFRIKSFINDKNFTLSTRILNIWCNKPPKFSKEILKLNPLGCPPRPQLKWHCYCCLQLYCSKCYMATF